MAFCEIPKGSINTQGNDTRRFFEFCSIHARAKSRALVRFVTRIG